jgi:hypothetical protein
MLRLERSDMNINILDPCTGQRITVSVPRKPRPEQQVKRQVLRQLDRSEAERLRSSR